MHRTSSHICRLMGIAAVGAALVLLVKASDGFGQVPCIPDANGSLTDCYSLTYYSNANNNNNPLTPISDATVRIVNPGAQGDVSGQPGPIPPFTLGNDLCADLYVFDAKQQLKECCGCVTTPNGELTLSVNKNLTHNPVGIGTSGPFPTRGVIKLVSALPTVGFSVVPGGFGFSEVCDPTSFAAFPFPTAVVPDLRAWATHIQRNLNPSFVQTEEEFEPAPLSPKEQADLAEDCMVVVVDIGSGTGVCDCTDALR